jgi:hypothetical protein
MPMTRLEISMSTAVIHALNVMVFILRFGFHEATPVSRRVERRRVRSLPELLPPER